MPLYDHPERQQSRGLIMKVEQVKRELATEERVGWKRPAILLAAVVVLGLGILFGWFLSSRAEAAPFSALQLVRAWERRPAKGERVRLSVHTDGRLLIVWKHQVGGKIWEAILEDKQGTKLEHWQITVDHAERFHPAMTAGKLLMARTGQDLKVGGYVLGRGEWESYGGIEEVVIGWKTCAVRPCPSSIFVFTPADGWWHESPWSVELFGVDLQPTLAAGATSTVAIASREQPNASGWTLRRADSKALYEGRVEVEARDGWKPPKGVSLEDPSLVQGSSPPMLIGGAALQVSGPNYKPSGRVYVAEQGGTLRMILQAAETLGNSEPTGSVHAGRFYVVAELAAGKSGLFGWTSGTGLEKLQEFPGEAPAVVAAEGRLWVSTSKGLWATPP
jgi:hypothetical protein